MSTHTTELRGLREENRTLYGVIKLVSSSVELGPMLQGIVDLATDATDITLKVSEISAGITIVPRFPR